MINLTKNIGLPLLNNIQYGLYSQVKWWILTSKSTGKRPLGRPRHRWEDNIRMDHEEIDINAGNWVDLAQDRDY